jgi:murein DD-endopeptidase MepM/ murein hydrolase activator NlpD
MHTVVSGDTLFNIAKRYGVTVANLRSWNKLSSDALKIGQKLIVKAPAPTPPTPVPPKPTPPTPVPPPPNPSPNTSNFLTVRQGFVLQTTPDNGFNRHVLRVPLNGGQVLMASMRDNLNMSRFMVYPNGISWAGQSRLELDLATIQSVGLTPQQARALQYVSTHEGAFDAINSFDKAISYGFIQFAGAAAVGSSLSRLMANMKANAPQVFQQIFMRAGIDVDNGTIVALDNNGRLQRGDEALLLIQRDLRLCGPFIQAGFEPALVREQLRTANQLYIQPALNFKLDVNIGGIRVVIPKISDVLQSEGALTAVFAIGINQGIGGMSKIVASSVGNVALQSGLRSAAELSRMDERAVIQNIADTAADTRVRDRALGVLREGMSFA